MVRSSNSTAAKLQKLSKADLIWCILEYEKHNLGWPSVDAILADLKYKKDIENIDRCEKLAKQSHEKRLAIGRCHSRRPQIQEGHRKH